MTRRLLVPAALFAVALPAVFLAAGCSGKHSDIVQNDEGAAPPAAAGPVSRIAMSDPSTKQQLTQGFYDLESGMWRWTGPRFSVMLKTPPGAAQKGATLTVALSVAEAALKQVHTQTLTAAIGSQTLKSEKYTTAGDHTFTADIPAASLSGDTVTIDFSVDHTLPPSASDKRELGVIVKSAGIETD